MNTATTAPSTTPASKPLQTVKLPNVIEARDLRLERHNTQHRQQLEAIKPFLGVNMVVTGAGIGGIAQPVIENFVAGGGRVLALDKAKTITTDYSHLNGAVEGVICDITDKTLVQKVIADFITRNGDIGATFLNAGILLVRGDVKTIDPVMMDLHMKVNCTGNLIVQGACQDSMEKFAREADQHDGFIPVSVYNISRNAQIMSPGNIIYSTSKEALAQGARCIATGNEKSKNGIRTALVFPDAVFDTKLWTPELVESSRLEKGYASADEYKRANSMGLEVKKQGVGNVITDLMTPTYSYSPFVEVSVGGGSHELIVNV